MRLGGAQSRLPNTRCRSSLSIRDLPLICSTALVLRQPRQVAVLLFNSYSVEMLDSLRALLVEQFMSRSRKIQIQQGEGLLCMMQLGQDM